jgi:outer membrane receptor protein involved in Fe transport
MRGFPIALTLAAAAASLGQIAGGNAFAQDAATPKGEIEEITVTAQKRTEDLTKVPASISVLSGATLENRHIDDFQDVTREVPGISFGAGATVSGGIVGPGTSNIVIRGISSASGSSTVAVYLDDLSITQGNLYDGAVEPKFLDFDRVEVLRGPQGTLFGASSMGGTVRLISNQPDLSNFSSKFTSDLSGTDHAGTNYVESATVNAPIVEGKLGFRAAVQYGSDSGYIDHLGTDGLVQKSGTNTERWDVLRSALKYRADDGSTATLSVLYQHDHTGDTPVFYPQVGLFQQNKSVVEPSTDNVFIPSLTLNKEFDDFTLTSVTGYFHRNFSFQSDGTFFNSAVIASAFLDPVYPGQQAQNDAIIGTLPSQVHRTDRTYQESEEIRATSKDSQLFGRSLNWIGGFFVENQRQVRNDFEPAPGLQSAFQQIYGFSIDDSAIGNTALHENPANAGFPTVSYAKDTVYTDNQWLDQVQYAAFGQVDYNILPNLKATAGLRYLYATQNYFRNSGGILAFGNVDPFLAKDHNYSATPKFSLVYDLSDQTSIYTTAAKGFRLGGPTGPVASTTCGADLAKIGIFSPPTGYGPDKLWSYEGGVKSRLLNNRMSINADVYYIDWSNIQQSINLPTCGASITQNLGSAESYGTEVEVRGKVMTDLTLSASGGINRAIITASPNTLTAAPGQDVLNTPKWTMTTAADYDFVIADSLDGTAHLDYDLVGSSHGSFNDSDPAFAQPSYGVLNGSIGIDTGPYSVRLYAKNLLNNNKIIQRPSINFVEEAYSLRPLTVGLTVSAQF